ncbi:MAG: class I SAM-dependent methyltransferase [Gammaproteobacteria bacterium]|nr:class I SAM-dependent methyltransferase [Gammaproteobacteria bacterium]
MLDIPCGDFNWMKTLLPELQLSKYIGADIVRDLVQRNQQRYGTAMVDFIRLDAVSDVLPKVDLILCRDMLVHLPLRLGLRAVGNMQNSESTYLLATTFPSVVHNENIETGAWRPLNLEAAPFNLGPPEYVMRESCADVPDKSLGLWRMSHAGLDQGSL